MDPSPGMLGAVRRPQVGCVVGRWRDTAHLWRYNWDTIDACIAPQDVLREAGFEQVQRHTELGVFSEYTARKPG